MKQKMKRWDHRFITRMKWDIIAIFKGKQNTKPKKKQKNYWTFKKTIGHFIWDHLVHSVKVIDSN